MRALLTAAKCSHALLTGASAATRFLRRRSARSVLTAQCRHALLTGGEVPARASGGRRRFGGIERGFAQFQHVLVHSYIWPSAKRWRVNARASYGGEVPPRASYGGEVPATRFLRRRSARHALLTAREVPATRFLRRRSARTRFLRAQVPPRASYGGEVPARASYGGEVPARASSGRHPALSSPAWSTGDFLFTSPCARERGWPFSACSSPCSVLLAPPPRKSIAATSPLSVAFLATSLPSASACSWDGQVDGALIVVAVEAEIRGTVGGDVYILATRLDLHGELAKDLHFAGGVLEIHEGAAMAG